MISPDHALLAWIAVSFVLTAMLPGYKAFTWAFLGAMFFLPSNVPDAFQIPGLPVLAKDAAVTYGVLPATLLFHAGRLTLRPKRDALLWAMALSAGCTSLANGLSFYDGVSGAAGHLLQFVLLVFLARVHLRTRDHVNYFLKSLYGLSVFYAALCVWEWRMSPQLHTLVYGYFPHSFLQMARGSFYRPVVFFGHGLEVGYLYAVVVLVGYGFIRNRDPAVPPWTLAAPVVALVCSMSMGPILFALFGWALLRLRARHRLGPVATLVPFGLLLLCVHLGRDRANFAFLVDVVKAVSPDRAASFVYRLHAFELYIRNIVTHPLFGHGTWGRGRIEGVAMDASLLIYLLAYGAVFVGLRYAWCWATLTYLRRRVEASRTAGRPGGPSRIDHVGAALYWVLWLAIVYDFIVEGTTLIVLVTCAAYRGDLRPEGRAGAAAGVVEAKTSAEPELVAVSGGE